MRMKNFSSLKMTKYEQCITGLAEKKKTFKIALSLKNICITVTEKKKWTFLKDAHTLKLSQITLAVLGTFSLSKAFLCLHVLIHIR